MSQTTEPNPHELRVPTAERRRFARWEVNLPVQEIHPEFHLMCATRVGAGGLYLPDAAPRPRGVPVLLELVLPGRRPPLHVSGRVAHAGRGAQGMGLGIEFNVPQPQLVVALGKPSA